MFERKQDTQEVEIFVYGSDLQEWRQVLTKIFAHRLTRILGVSQPIEPVSFRSGYHTIDHVHIVNQIKDSVLCIRSYCT